MIGGAEILLALLAVLSVGGVAVADFSAKDGLDYWLVMVPVFAGASIFAAWRRSRSEGQSIPHIVRRHVVHWSALPLAMYLIYVLEQTGRLNREVAGLVALLTLAVTTFLAGVHFDWRLGVLGIVLGIGAACAALIEEFFWVFLIAAAVAVAVLVVWHRYGSWGRDLTGQTAR